MKTTRLLLSLIALVALVAAAAPAKVDVTGKWDFAVETGAGSGSPKFEFKQDGEKLTGSYSGQLGQANLTGTVKDNKISFKFSIDQLGEVQYSGDVAEDGTMKGTVKLGELGEDTFTG